MWGFTRTESGVLIFLMIGFVVGMGVWTYRSWIEPLPEIPHERATSAAVLQEDDGDRGSKSDFPISINTASAGEFEKLPGIGPVMARRIVEYRLKKGPFFRVDQLKDVKGIGEKTLEKIKPLITI